MKKLLSIITLFALVGTSLFAQGQKSHKKHKKSEAHKTELRQHYEQKVYPVLKAEHTAFEAALSSDDLNFLMAKRAEAKTLKQEQRNMRKAMKAQKVAGNSKETVKAAFAEQRAELKAKRKALMESLEPFMEDHQNLIQQHIEVLKPYHKEWRAERQAIHQKHVGEDFQERKKRAKHQHKAALSEAERAERQEARKKRKVLRFLLWDGELKKNEAVDVEENELVDEESSEKYQLSAYPNPASQETKVKFQLAEAANRVLVKVADFNASILNQVELNKLKAGHHSVQLSLAGLKPGTYVLILEVDGNSVTELIQVQ